MRRSFSITYMGHMGSDTHRLVMISSELSFNSTIYFTFFRSVFFSLRYLQRVYEKFFIYSKQIINAKNKVFELGEEKKNCLSRFTSTFEFQIYRYWLCYMWISNKKKEYELAESSLGHSDTSELYLQNVNDEINVALLTGNPCFTNPQF